MGGQAGESPGMSEPALERKCSRLPFHSPSAVFEVPDSQVFWPVCQLGPSASHRIVSQHVFSRKIPALVILKGAFRVVSLAAQLTCLHHSLCFDGVPLASDGTVRAKQGFSPIFWSWDYKTLKKVVASSPDIFAGT